MNEIPVPYLRANQTGMVILVILAAIVGQPWIIAVLWLIEAAGLVFGVKGNLFIRTAKPFLQKKIAQAETEARELTRFNNTLAVLFLSISLVFFVLGWPLAGYITAGLLAGVALIAISGYCLGCFLYFQVKQFRRKFTKTKSS